MSYSSEVLADSALVYWRLGEAGTPATAVDASGNGHDGSYAYGTTGVPRLTLGTPGLLTGDSDTAATFAGANWFDPGYVSIAHAAWMDVSAVTLECWVKTTATGFQMLWDRDPGGSSNRPWQFRLNNGKFEFVRVCNSAGGVAVVAASSTIAVNDGARHHLVATYDGSTIKLYIDGALNNTVTASGGLCVTSTDGLRFGLSQGGQGCYTGGVGDELAYYGTVLSATRIAAHYNAGVTTSTPTYVGTLAANAPRATITLAGTYAEPSTPTYSGTLAAVSPRATVALIGTYAHQDGVFTGTLTAKAPAAFAMLSGTYSGTIGTNTANKAGGRDRRGRAVVTYDPPVATPPATVTLPERKDVAYALPDPQLVDGRPTGEWTQARPIIKAGGRDRVIIGGVDVTYFRGEALAVPSYNLREPLAYGECSLDIPQVSTLEAAPSWARKFARVKFQRVFDDGSKMTDYRGVVLAVRKREGHLVLDIGGQVTGLAELRNEQPPLRWVTHDVGWWAFNATRPFLHMTPRFGPKTGIRIPRSGAGGTTLAWIEQICVESQQGGKQRTIMPTTWGGNEWTFDFKDRTTVDATIFLDGTFAREDLVDDASEQPNTFFGTGVTPDGMRIRNSRYPQAMDAPAAAYPVAGGADFGVGTTDADTRDGSGITVMQIKLQWAGYLDQDDYTHGTYDAATAAGVKRCQRDVGLPVTGTMDRATWNRLWNEDATGISLKASHIAPLVQDPRVADWLYSANGSIVGKNPNRDKSVERIDRNYDFGGGVTKSRMIDYCESQYERAQGVNYAGTITLNGAGGFAGKWELGDTPPASAVMGVQDFRAGMNVYLPGFDGSGITVRIANVDVTPGSLPTAVLSVDTQARDMLELSEIIERNRSSRRSPRREWNAENRPHGPSYNAITFDEFGGVLPQDRRLQGGKWNKVGIIAGQTGILERIDLLLNNKQAEFCFAVASRDISPAHMQRRAGNPFPVNSDGESWIETGPIQDWLDDKTLLYAAGSEDNPCGYGKRQKFAKMADDQGNPVRSKAPLTGHYRDDAGVPYKTPSDRNPLLWLLIYPDRDCTLQSGRLLYKSEDDAA